MKLSTSFKQIFIIWQVKGKLEMPPPYIGLVKIALITLALNAKYLVLKYELQVWKIDKRTFRFLLADDKTST